MRSLQICLLRSWDRLDLDAPVSASAECLRDLQWWLHLPRLSLECLSARCLPTYTSGQTPQMWGGVPILIVRSLQACGTRTRRRCPSTPENCSPSNWVFTRFQSSLQGRTVAVLCDNTTAVAYLRKEGGTRSPLLNTLAQAILHWSESLSICLAPQFLPGSNNVLADALSRPHQLPHSEWSLNVTVFQSLRRLWPVQIDLFATSENHRCSIYFSPFRDLMSAGTDAFLQSWDGLQAYAFPPVAIIPRVLAKLRASTGTELTLVALHGPAPLVLRPAPALAGPSSDSAVPSRPPTLASVSSSLSGSPSAQASCLATLQRFTRAAGFSSAVAEQSSLACRPSSRALY